MTTDGIYSYKITKDNFNIHKTILQPCITNYYERSFYYHSDFKGQTFEELQMYLHSDDITIVTKNNKVIGFYVLLSNAVDFSISFCIFLHPQACKMGAMTLINEATKTVLDLPPLTHETFVYIAHHSMLLIYMKNLFNVYTLNRVTDTFLIFSARLDATNINKEETV